MVNDKRIDVLETGTNEIEIMRFTIDGNMYGINVYKVSEIMLTEPVRSMPHSHFAVEGIYKPRDTVITVIDLPSYINSQKSPHNEKDLFIVTNFNKMSIAFRVHTVEGISRISWADIQKPDNALASSENSIVTCITECAGEIVSILDFEKIVSDIAPETSIQEKEIDELGQRNINSKSIWLAEDSALLTQLIHSSLTKARFTSLKMFSNGAELWDALNKLDASEIEQNVKLIITDIEMPKMDGHHLTKLIKDSTKFSKIPVVIFSSLISEQMWVRGTEVGADAQLSKPEIGKLVGIIDDLLKDK